MTIFKRISLQSIIDWARQNIEPLRHHYESEMFMDDATSDWGKYNSRFLQHYHPEMYDEFVKIGGQLRYGTVEDQKLLYAVLTCSRPDACKKSICPLCQLDEQEEAAAALQPTPIPTKQSTLVLHVQSAAVRKLLFGLKTDNQKGKE